MAWGLGFRVRQLGLVGLGIGAFRGFEMGLIPYFRRF